MAEREIRSTEILLEVGTNELELLEFQVGENLYGINIAKVLEIMRLCELVPMPQTAPEIEGVFMPRDKLVTVIDLHKVLNIEPEPDERGMLIICHFNTIDMGFHVSTVHGIRRISWKDIEKPPTISTGEDNGVATGVVKIGDKILVILDFEKIVSEVNATAALNIEGIDMENTVSGAVSKKQIVVAEDSQFLNKLIVSSLNDIGFSNVVSFPNGEAAWEYVATYKNAEGPITNSIAALVTDIEMPKMDGHRLTKQVKSDPKLSKIPVYLFSSLINDQMYQKGLSVGADGQFSKPQIGDLIKVLVEKLSEE